MNRSKYSFLFVGICAALCVLISGIFAACIPTGDQKNPPVSTASNNSTLPSLSGIASKVLPSVVYVMAGNSDTQKEGSGVILSPDGYILTNRHVVEGAKTVTVILYDRSDYPVSLDKIWMDDVVDLAVIKINERDLPTLRFGNADNTNVGDWVLAVGHALGLSPEKGGATVSEGIISNLNRSFNIDSIEYYDVIQTTAAINPGNSGGPLVNLAGEIIGINSAGVTDAQGVGFAINTGTAQHIYQDLVKYGKPHHPFIGVDLDDVTPNTMSNRAAPKIGALVKDIEPEGPADIANLKNGDVIIQFDNVKITTAADLIENVWLHEPGDKVDITYWRNGTQTKTSLILIQRPQTNAI